MKQKTVQRSPSKRMVINMNKRWIWTAGFVLITALILATAVSADEGVRYVPYSGYLYNSYEESVPAPVGYEPAAVLSGTDLGVDSLSSPEDLFMSPSGELYLLDSGNGRILVLDRSLKLRRKIDRFILNGEELSITGAKGFFVCEDGSILIADTSNYRVLVCDASGNVRRVLERPETDLIDEMQPFEAVKVMQDPVRKAGVGEQNAGNIYVLVKGINKGAVTFRPDGSFGGFYASNDLERTAEVIIDYIWSMFQTEKQKEVSKKRTPPEITNFDIDADGFVYTVTETAKSSNRTAGENVRKINFKGSNILKWKRYGDYEWDRDFKKPVITRFVDIDVDENGYMVMLDAARGRVFEYTSEGMMVSVSGGMGQQNGTFLNPTAVETGDGKIYVTDNLLNALVVYEPTEYTKAFKTAYNLFQNGQYAESLESWKDVLRLSSNGEIAYYGIGAALAESGKYKEALPYYRASYSNSGYSDAFMEVRADFIKRNFVLLILAAVLLVAGTVVLMKQAAKRLRRANVYSRSALETKYTYPIFTALHPYDGFDQLKTNKRFSVQVSLMILLLYFLAVCAKWFFTGFTFMDWRISDFNILIVILQVFGSVLILSVSNWAACTLIEGKGRFKEIFCTISYGMLPHVVGTLVALLLSNVLVEKEGAFLAFCTLLGLVWTVVVIVTGLGSIHQFGFMKNLLSVLLTLAGFAVILFLGTMFFGLLNQVREFFISVYSELQMMM